VIYALAASKMAFEDAKWMPSTADQKEYTVLPLHLQLLAQKPF